MVNKTRARVAEIAREMAARGLTDGTSGNISIMDQDSKLIAVTPSGMPYQKISKDDVPVINQRGEIVVGDRQPTSEYRMHLAVLNARKDFRGVIHTHSRFSIAIACVHQALPAITVDMAAYCGQEAPLVPYLTPGTDRLAEAVAAYYLEGQRALLLANHGAIFAAPDPDLLIDGAEALELAAMAYVRGQSFGIPKPIPNEEIELLLDLVYGQKRAV